MKNKIELLKMIKTRIAPIAVCISVGPSISGCKTSVNEYHSLWNKSSIENIQLTQKVYENIDMLKSYDHIDNNISKIGNCYVMGVGKIINDEMKYGFIDENFKEVIPIGKYTSIDTFITTFYSADSNIITELVPVYNDSTDKNLYGYIDPNTLEEVIPLNDWKGIIGVGTDMLKAEKHDGTFEIYRFKKEENKTLSNKFIKNYRNI